MEKLCNLGVDGVKKPLQGKGDTHTNTHTCMNSFTASERVSCCASSMNDTTGSGEPAASCWDKRWRRILEED
eukprot:1160037-Pelagomonas_calceolata.AAC.4